MSATVTVRVRHGWAVFDGEHQVNGGELVEVDQAVAEAWIAAGWVTPAEPERPEPKRTARPSKGVTTAAS